jgi:hypothetical protein
MSRLLTIAASALLALAAPVQAQTSTNPAPSTDPGTKLNFPASLGGATLEQSLSEGGSVAYMYGINKMQIYVYIEGDRRVPAGSDTPVLMSRFTAEVNEVEAKLKSAGYTRFERPAVPSSCSYGSIAFRCIVYSVHSTGGRLFSKLLLTGYHDHFLKIRIDWTSGIATQADADRALQSFVPALVH